MRFLLGRHAMFGHEPPNHLRSTMAVRWPSLAIVQARYLPASPLPTTRISYLSTSGTGLSPFADYGPNVTARRSEPYAADPVPRLTPRCAGRARQASQSPPPPQTVVGCAVGSLSPTPKR